MSEWIASFNSGELEQARAFRLKYHRKSDPQDAVDFHQVTGDLHVLKIERDEPNAIVVVVVESESDQVLRQTIETDPDDPTTLLKITLAGTERPDDLALPRTGEAEALRNLELLADDLVAHDRLSGAMLVERRGKIILEQCWGLADREKRVPITRDTKFRLGSANKMFTAVSVLQLVERGKLSLDGTVGAYLPDYPNQAIASKVTIRQLLTHTGGTGDIFTDEFMAKRATLKVNGDYVALYGARDPEFEPGSQARYSNYGFVLLGYIVEKVSGMSYYDYVRDHVYRPAGMTHTGSLPEDVVVPQRSLGYVFDDGHWASNADTLPYRGMAAGGGYSTLDDLLRFAHALQSGKLLSKHWLDEATRGQSIGGWYGYGFETAGHDATRHYGHSGGAPGMNAEFRVFPDAGVIAIALSNETPPSQASRLVEFYTLRMPLGSPH